MNIFDIIKQETQAVSGKIAVIEADDRITYGRLLSSAGLVAEELHKKGVGRLHRVGLLCDDSIDYIIVTSHPVPVSYRAGLYGADAGRVETVIDGSISISGS
jgi:non-ribosomal peptide synthetase component F